MQQTSPPKMGQQGSRVSSSVSEVDNVNSNASSNFQHTSTRHISTDNPPCENSEIILSNLIAELVNEDLTTNQLVEQNSLDEVKISSNPDCSLVEPSCLTPNSNFPQTVNKVSMCNFGFSEAEVYANEQLSNSIDNHNINHTNYNDTHNKSKVHDHACLNTILPSISADVYAAKVRICQMNVQRCKQLLKGYDQCRLNVGLDSIEFVIKLHSSMQSTNRPVDFYNHKSALQYSYLVSKN